MITSTLVLCSMMAQIGCAFRSTVASRGPLAMIASRGESRGDIHSLNGGAYFATSTRATRSIRSTRLQYSSGRDGGSSNTYPAVASSGGRGWWETLFTTDDQDTTTLEHPRTEEQANVDAYLEFLDRRYKRLHSNDRVTVDSQSSNPVPFSAMSWLMNGKDETFLPKQPSEDALYVLGVAGLASQKLLQKHHLPTAGTGSTATTPPAKETSSQAPSGESRELGVIDAELVAPANMLVTGVLVPLVRAIHVVQRCKQLTQQKLQDKMKSIGARAVQKVIRPVRKSKDIRSILKGLLELGGGKRNVMVTLACLYATVLLLRPLLKGAFAEVSMHP
jgi:hypothetical protein